MLAAAHGEAGVLQDLGTDAADVFLRDLVNKLVVIATATTAGEPMKQCIIANIIEYV